MRPDGVVVVASLLEKWPALVDRLQIRFYTLVVTALGTGLRRGEFLALRWQDVDLEARSLRVERPLGEAEGKVYFKSPKSQAGRRSLSLAATVVEALRTHRRR